MTQIPSGPQSDDLFRVLNPLVSERTLAPHQADAVYRALSASSARAVQPGSEDRPGWQRPRLLATLAILALGLLVAGYSLGSTVDFEDGFSWKGTLLVLGASAVAAAVAAAYFTILTERPWAAFVRNAFAGIALAGFAASLTIMWEPEALVYVAGAVMLLGGAVGYWLTRGVVLALVAGLGGAVLLAQIFDDTLSGGGDDTGDILMVGIAFLVYGLLFAAVGWFTSHRHLLGVVGSGAAVLSMLVVIVANSFLLALQLELGDSGTADGGSGGPDLSDLRSDIRVAMLLGIAAAVLAAAAHAYSGAVGFVVVAFIGAAALPSIGIAATQTDHPIRWAAGLLLVGTIGAGAVVALQVLERRSPGHSAAPPPAGSPLYGYP